MCLWWMVSSPLSFMMMSSTSFMVVNVFSLSVAVQKGLAVFIFSFNSSLVGGTSHISPVVCVWSFYLDKQAGCVHSRQGASVRQLTALLRP